MHVARIAQEEGVRLYSLGTETNNLFRTRSGGDWPNHYGAQLKDMVRRVRAVYWRLCGAGGYGPAPPRSAAPSWVGASASGSVYWISTAPGQSAGMNGHTAGRPRHLLLVRHRNA